MPQMASPANRIHQGESCGVIFWSNSSAHSMTGTFRIMYDDGTEDEFGVNRLGSAGTRVAQFAYTKRAALKDGYVVSLAVGMANATIVRGQCYAMAIAMRTDGVAVADVASAAALVTVLAQDYVWFGHPLRLGVYIEAGPAGGHGHFRSIVTADPAAGAEIVATAVPTGALWRIQGFSVQLVQGITQTPLPTIVIRTGGGANTAFVVPITTVAIGASSTALLTWGRGLVQSSFTAVVGDEFHTAPLPLVDMIAGDDIRTNTDGIGANTNYGVAVISLEEWVVPN